MKVASRSKDAWLAEIRYKKQRQEVPGATRLRPATGGQRPLLPLYYSR